MDGSIPSLDTFHMPFEDDASTKVGNDSDEDSDYERSDRELRNVFEEKLRDNVKIRSYCHTKVAVLLIDWVKNGEGYLDTNAEVNRLVNVFKKKYRFSVRRRRLDTELSQPVSHQMEKFLTDFKFDKDGDDSLLIIYYAGHGLNDGATPGTLNLSPSTTRPFPHARRTNHVMWNQAEERIKDTKADLLLIFDCCYAGELASSERIKRGNNYGKIFDFLGASQSNERAMGPGLHSFTSALIWALNECAGWSNGFTLLELRNKIQRAPNFQCFPDPSHHQVPCIGYRNSEPSLQQLRICPLRENTESTQQHRQGMAQHQPARPKYYLELEFLFSDYPQEEEIVYLCKQLRIIMSDPKYPLQHVLWRGLSPHQKWIQRRWQDVTRQIMLQKRRSSLLSPVSDNNQVPPTPQPAITVNPPFEDIQDLPHNSAGSVVIHDGFSPLERTQSARWKRLILGESQTYVYATILIQRRLGFLFMICFVFTLAFLVVEHHPDLPGDLSDWLMASFESFRTFYGTAAAVCPKFV